MVTTGEKLAARAGFALIDASEPHALSLLDGYWICVGAQVDSGELAAFAFREQAKRAGKNANERAIRQRLKAHGLRYFPPRAAAALPRKSA